jgi:hypothetical protein
VAFQTNGGTSNITGDGNAGFHGISTSSSGNSLIYINSGGAFYNRTFSGADASCSGITDGWQGIRTDTHQLEVCIGGTLYALTL